MLVVVLWVRLGRQPETATQARLSMSETPKERDIVAHNFLLDADGRIGGIDVLTHPSGTVSI